MHICVGKTDLFKLEQVRLTLEFPTFRLVLRRLKRLEWLPILDEATFVGGDNTVVLVTVLHRRSAAAGDIQWSTHSHDVHWKTMKLVKSFKRFAIASPIIQPDDPRTPF